jgi:hypothetical protein
MQGARVGGWHVHNALQNDIFNTNSICKSDGTFFNMLATASEQLLQTSHPHGVSLCRPLLDTDLACGHPC